MSFAKLEDAITVPLFPLRIVLFPAGRHDLQIFERRYIDMVTDCLKSGTPFGICSIEAGTEARVQQILQQSVSRIGTLARIIDWNQLDNGLLGITIEGTTKFRVEDCWESDTDLIDGRRLCSARAIQSTASPLPTETNSMNWSRCLKGSKQHPLVAEKELGYRIRKSLAAWAGISARLIPMGENSKAGAART